MISRYRLAYDTTAPNRQQLTQITRFGSDGDDRNYLPPTRFRYSGAQPAPELSAADALLSVENAPSSVMDNGLVELIDLNRDGLPDLLHTDLYGGGHRVSVNRGQHQRSGRSLIELADPVPLQSADGRALAYHLAEGQVSLTDMNADGIADLVHTSLDQGVAYFPNSGALAWNARRPMSAVETIPPAPAALEAVETLDLDFDKRMDVVMSTDSGYRVWYNQRAGAWSREVRTPGARIDDRVLAFGDDGVQFADMNGDQLMDVAQIGPTQIRYVAGLGYGRFAEAVEIPIPDVVLTDGSNGHETHGVDASTGKARKMIKRWFGDGLHPLIDTGELLREKNCLSLCMDAVLILTRMANHPRLLNEPESHQYPSLFVGIRCANLLTLREMQRDLVQPRGQTGSPAAGARRSPTTTPQSYAEHESSLCLSQLACCRWFRPFSGD
ncbi:MAG: hypothetical protein C1943_15360 [Halochromatium sp.]|nr:hypothetical protein [Halochromatium sp.]